jgi:hypothetical protein
VRAPAHGPSRPFLLAGILVAHALLIYWMAMSRISLRPERSAEFRSQPIFLMPLIEEPPPLRRAITPAPAPANRSQVVPTESTAITLVEPVPVAPAGNPPDFPIDWNLEAAKAIQKMEQSDSNAVLFGDLPQAEQTTKAPHGVFEKRNPREAGYIEELAPGITRRWISEKCYQEFGHLPPLFAGQGPAVNPVRCIMEGDPYGDLFDHLKPEYLKKSR